MAKLPFLTLSSTVDNLRTTTNNLNNLIGDLALLNTAGDSDLVQAINFVDSDTNARIDSADAYFKARIVSEVATLNNTIDNLDSDVGTRTLLTTTNKTSVVAAVNEVTARVDLLDSANVTGSIAIIEDRLDSNDAGFVSRVRGSLSAGGDIAYNSSTGQFSIDVEQIYTKANFDSDLSLALSTNAVTTTNLSEGTNLYYTTARVESAFDTRLATKTTTDLAEGTNQYFTQARARTSVSVTDAGGDGSLSYNNTTGVLTYTGPSAAEVRAHVSAVDNGGDGSFTYSSSTGVFTYTGPSASEVRAHFSEGEGIDISSGVISGEDASTTNKGIASFNSSRFTVTSGAVDIATGGIANAQLGAGAVNSAKLTSATTLTIFNSAGSAIKTLIGAGS
jgi:hypothetical protein